MPPSSVALWGIVTIEYSQIEIIGFVPLEVFYKIYGSVTPWIPATHEDPPAGGEREITHVTRFDPIENEYHEVLHAEWPFSPGEMVNIYDQLSRASVVYRDYDFDGDKDLD